MRHAPLAVRAHRMFDGLVRREGPVTVLIVDGRIVDVDLTGADPPDGYALDDWGDATILPGLIDAHSHLSFDPADPFDEDMRLASDEQILRRIRMHAAQALGVGVTTVRDLGDRNYLTLQVRDQDCVGDLLGAEIIAAGPPLTSAGGHCASLGGVVQGAAEMSGAVTDHAEAGVDVIKVMATGGMGADPAAPQFTDSELTLAVQRAHARQLPVVAHAHASRGIRSAVDAGVDGIEHCSFMTASGVRRDPQIIDDLAAAGIHVGCTVARPRSDMPQAVLDTLEPYWANNAYMHSRGINVVCCTDAGINPAKPHDVLPDDLAYFASQVCTTLDALRSVTSLAASSCNVAHRKGRIAAAHDADLLIADGDPTRLISDLARTRAVYRAGSRCSRARL